MNLGAYPAVAVAKQQVGFPAGGRLTLVQNAPVIATDQTAKAIIYYTPDRYGAFPVIKNGVIRPVYFTDDLKLTMTSAFTGSGIFDLFGIERGGKAVMVAGTAWATATAGSGARGTTPGQTELIRVAGMNVNRWGLPGLSAENATYIAPLEGFYLGSVHVDAAAGQTSCHVSYGQSRKWGVWNAHNRAPITLQAGDGTVSWTYTSATIRASNADSANKFTTFCGLPEEAVDCRFVQTASGAANNSACTSMIGIGLNSTTLVSGKRGQQQIGISTAGSVITLSSDLKAEYLLAPQIGINDMQGLEGSLNANTSTFSGTNTFMVLSGQYRG